jgi:16S rRNA (uracil1498-N3)-methyltransferase
VERWKRIAKEASEQSRRLRAPELADPVRLVEAFQDTSTHRIILDEQPGAKPLVRLFAFRSGDSAAAAIGPEGGWIDTERRQFQDAGWSAASLGPAILRAETAVCAALSVFLQMWFSAISQ